MFWPSPANAMVMWLSVAPGPFRMVAGYSIVAFEPMLPDTHSIVPSCSTMARLVLRLYVFFDQFCTVEYWTWAFSPTKTSTHPLWRLKAEYFGAEQPSM